ncbi:MAG: ABC transporter substrate-binding protein, partial [Candidatus Promineifilaceae bacterium]
ADDIFAPADTTEFTPYMEQVMDSGAQAFLVTWAGGGFVPMMQAAQELGVMDEQVMASAFVDNVVLPTFFANAIGTTSGILYHYTAANNEINDWLVSKTMENQGVPPDLFDADAMNAALLIANALRATGGDVSAEAMIAAMEGMEFEGPKGTIYIRPEDHVAIQDMYIVTLTNVDDPEFRFFDYVATTRPDVPCLLPEELKDRCGDLPYGSLSGE